MTAYPANPPGGETPMLFEQIMIDITDGVMTITLNHPERLNAWTQQMGIELIEAFDLADGDDDVRAIIVTGAGRGFCAGADLAGGGETFDHRANGRSEEVQGIANRAVVGTQPTPTIPRD